MHIVMLLKASMQGQKYWTTI